MSRLDVTEVGPHTFVHEFPTGDCVEQLRRLFPTGGTYIVKVQEVGGHVEHLTRAYQIMKQEGTK